MTFDEMMGELQKEYVQSLPEKIATLKKFWSAKDIESLKNEFHKLKGTGKTYGVPEISDYGLKMETLCKENPSQLETEFEVAIKTLTDIYESRK